MWAFLLGTKTGHALIGVVACLIVGFSLYAYGHHQGYAEGAASIQAKLDSALKANGTDEATIDQLKQANIALAASVTASKASEAKAKADVAAAKKTAQNATQTAQKAMRDLYAKDHVAGDWAKQPIPAGVLSQLQH